MATDNELWTTVQALEEELLTPQVRGDAGRLRELLAEDFEEVGASGRCFRRDAVIEALLQEGSEAVALQMEGCRARPLTKDLVLLRYRSQRSTAEGVRWAERTTLWRRSECGWQAIFHQGTVIPPATQIRRSSDSGVTVMTLSED